MVKLLLYDNYLGSGITLQHFQEKVYRRTGGSQQKNSANFEDKSICMQEIPINLEPSNGKIGKKFLRVKISCSTVYFGSNCRKILLIPGATYMYTCMLIIFSVWKNVVENISQYVIIATQYTISKKKGM